MDRPLRRLALVALLLAALPLAHADKVATPAVAAASQGGYQLPPAPLQALVDAPRPPSLSLSPHRDLLAFLQNPALPGIDLVAQPELKLAGVRINPRTYAQSRFSFGSDLWLQDIASGKEIRVQGLPQPLAIASIGWSPDQKYLAFNQVNAMAGTNELWLVDVQAHTAHRLTELPLNTVAGRGYNWLPDSSGLLVQLRAQGQGAAPAENTIPTGPATQETRAGGGVKSIPTVQDLLHNEDDARIFAHYITQQAAIVDLAGKVTNIGEPSMSLSLRMSPDGQYLLRQRIERPFSYIVPVDNFPRRIEVLDRNGKLVKEIAKQPLIEGLPTGNDAVRTGVRDINWRADAPATLVWAEAQDGGDPARAADVRDLVLTQAAPFTAEPVTLARLGSRYASANWANGDLAVITEYWWKTRKIKEWRVAPDHPEQPAALMREGSSEDRYQSPGALVSDLDERGQIRLLLSADGSSVFRMGDGASPEGDRPFVDKVNLASGKATRLFRSQAPFYEEGIAVLDPEGKQLLISRESPDEPTNFYVSNTADTKAAPRALTHIAHPTPQLRGVKKEQIRYKRKDGVELTATLYLPPNYNPKKDGPRPMLMWAYPTEFKSASAAGQVTGSPYKFNRISYWGPQAFLAMGYTVWDNFSVPIVGEGNKEPNDTYVPQLVASAEAAVDEAVRRGVADRNRIAVGGHSYGAFMTANLLAHTRLFKAGIARSGAYNRTLTPFGFQSEERNYWQAENVYNEMSPFNYANDIKDALLMIHGEQDNNSGTYPIQSERLYAAIKGLGGTARLVMLPNEAHAYRARESIMQMLAESNAWLEKYVKQAPASKDASSK